ncbi:MAG: 16S rRNA (cytosine(967)-C(5))-methyltransferase RsmB [Burkholderiales bacterium]
MTTSKQYRPPDSKSKHSNAPGAAAPRPSAPTAAPTIAQTRGMVAVQIATAEVVGRVLGGKNLDRELSEALSKKTELSSNERQAVHSISFDVLRHYGLLNAQLDVLLTQPLTDKPVRFLLLVALAQLQFSKVAAHMVVDNAVTACVEMGFARAKGLANAILRNLLRAPEKFERSRFKDAVATFDHPRWWINRLQVEYPSLYQEIMNTARARPPMHLRVNVRHTDATAYIALLADLGISAHSLGAEAIAIESPVPVSQLPKFSEGWVSVQDFGAQQAAHLLGAEDGMRVLDACAAPGGKSAHILELKNVHLTALDSDKLRLKRVTDNLGRLKLSATVKYADAAVVDTWWDKQPYDRILLDVPCSGSGVTRRHPDIKWIRRETDIKRFAIAQHRLLASIWNCLRVGGRLLYVTCSVFREENQGVIEQFLVEQPTARRLSISVALASGVGHRLVGQSAPIDSIADGVLLPADQHDGFYFALLEKVAANADAIRTAV